MGLIRSRVGHVRARPTRKRCEVGGLVGYLGVRRGSSGRTEPAEYAMLTSIRIQNFKSVEKSELHLAELTLLIGANASGKSNVLEAIQLLSWIAGNGRFESIQSAMKDRQLRIRGSARNLTRMRNERDLVFHLGCVIEDVDQLGRLELDMGIEQTARGIRIVTESLRAPQAYTALPLYKVVEPAGEHSNQITVEYNNFARGKNKPQIFCADQQAVFVQLVSPARFGATHTDSQRLIPAATSAVQKWLVGILFLDPNPAVMRGYSYRSELRMQGDGANVSAVLHDLCEIQGRKSEVLDFVRSLPEQDIRDIQFSTTARDEVLLELTETFGNVEHGCEAGLLSDGTLRVLAVAATLLSVDEGSLVVIEEIDNGVHPNRAAMLLRAIRDVAARRKLHVLLTSHNPALLDALPASSLPDVTVCYRGDAGESRLVRLQDVDRYASIVAEGPLGSLVTQGVIDRYVKAPAVDEAAARKRALDLIESLMPGPEEP
jgi:predicted ATPase